MAGAYHITLSDDMLTTTSEPVRIDSTISGDEYKDHMFFEGSSIRKIFDSYYFIYSSINNHELCYAMSKRPNGDFIYKGTIISNGDIGYQGRQKEERLNHTGTNHGSIEKIENQWYVFYHRLTHNSDYSRQACAERIEILADGSIPQVEVTSCGLNGGPLHSGTYPAAICCNLTNGHMTHASNSKGGLEEPCVTSNNQERYITGITDGTLIGYKYFKLKGEIKLSITARGGNGVFEVSFGTKIALKDAREWTEYETEFTIKEGIYPLYLTYRGEGMVEMKEIKIGMY